MRRIGLENTAPRLDMDSGDRGLARGRNASGASRPSIPSLDRGRGTELRRFRDGQQPELVRVGGFGTPLMNGAGRVEFRWKPGSTIQFGAGLDLTSLGVERPPRNVKVELWTN